MVKLPVHIESECSVLPFGLTSTHSPSREASVYTSAEFQRVREALLKCSDADRAYLRRWIIKWIDERRYIRPDAEKLPDKGC